MAPALWAPVHRTSRLLNRICICQTACSLSSDGDDEIPRGALSHDLCACACSEFIRLAMPPSMLMWASMYAVLFTIAGGMITYLYNPD